MSNEEKSKVTGAVTTGPFASVIQEEMKELDPITYDDDQDDTLLADATVGDAIDILKKAFKDDPRLEYKWHCNIAMACYDSIDLKIINAVGLAHNDAHKIGNEAASRFMKLAFDIVTAWPGSESDQNRRVLAQPRNTEEIKKGWSDPCGKEHWIKYQGTDKEQGN